MAGDGIFAYRDGIAVAQVVAFSMSLLFGVYFRYAHRIGWFCTIIFSLFRLVGASCMLATINNDSKGLWAGVFVCESLGMILILFLTLEMLMRVNKIVPVVRKRIFIIPQIITWIDIGVSIGGFVAVTRKEDQLAPTPYSQAGMTLIAIIYLYVVGVFVVFWLRRADFLQNERRAVMCVAMCAPLMAVRVTYSLIFIITADRTFNAVKGNSTAYLLMTMLPEVGIIAVCTWTIMKIPPLTRSETGKSKWRRWRQGKNESQQKCVPSV